MAGFIASIFGMNLRNHMETENKRWYQVTIISIGFALIGIMLVTFMLKRTGVFPKET